MKRKYVDLRANYHERWPRFATPSRHTPVWHAMYSFQSPFSQSLERIPRTSELLAHSFATDPVIAYLLHNMPEAKRLAYLPAYFSALLTAAGMNDAVFTEIGDYKSCIVMMPPEKRVDNPWTIIPAGLIQMMWNAGLGPCWVSSSPDFIFYLCFSLLLPTCFFLVLLMSPYLNRLNIPI